MKFLRLLCLLPALVILLATCKEAGAPTDANGNPIGNVTTTLAGIVVDESGQPVSGAAIIANSKNAVTDKYGTFMIQNASVPGNRCVILCKKNGYFTGSRAETPKGGGITELRLTLQSSAPGYTVNSSTGGTLTIGTASVKFPPSAFVTSDGKPFTGTVSVAAKHLDPSQASFYNSFSGDMTARRTDGTQTELLSYGVLRVRLTDEFGAELKLAAGKTATLTYPIAASQQKAAPASMPLWYFDEALGMWKEEGVATKTGDSYSGDVSHFTDWNCDVPAKTGIVKGRVMCNNEGVAGIYVTVGQLHVITDKNGYFSTRAPINVDFTISILPSENGGLAASDIDVPALHESEERMLNIQLTHCPEYITGLMVDCNDNPVAARIIVTYPNGYKYCGTTTGEFKILVPTGLLLAIEATTFNGNDAVSRSIGMVNPGEVKDIGRISACAEGGTSGYVDIVLGLGDVRNTVFSPDGSLIAINGKRIGVAGWFTEVYNTKTGEKVCQYKDDIAVEAVNFSDDGSKLLLRWFDKNEATVVNPRTGATIQRFGNLYKARLLPNGEAVITENYTVIMGITLSLYSVATGQKIKQFSFSDIEERHWNLEGTRGSSHFILVNSFLKQNNYLISQTKIIDWDIANDKKSNELLLDGAYYFQSTGCSPDFSTISIYDYDKSKDLIYYDTKTGYKQNSARYGHFEFYNAPTAIANDLSFVMQDNNSDTVFYPPTTYKISDRTPLKTLAIPTPITRYWNFIYSSNSQYIAGVEGFAMSEPPMVVRIWKVK